MSPESAMPPSHLPNEVVRRARSGDAAAFRRIVEAYERVLFRIAYRIALDAEEARDLCQEALLRVHQNLEQYDPERPFEPWLYRVATNVCLNWKKRPRRVEPVGGTEELDLRANAAAPAEEPGDPERLRGALTRLPAEYRTVLAMRYEQGCTYELIAERTGQPLGTVKTWIFRAKLELKNQLAGRPSGADERPAN
jgi:RNA polymerase sigma-70 factor (ECF subfamily)